MAKAKKEKMNNEQQYVQYPAPDPTAVDKERFVSSEKLQTFYNEAYIGERDRLNAMFGRLDTLPVVEQKIVYRDPDLSGYVRIEQYKKKKNLATLFGILFGLAAAAAIVFALLYLNIIG